MSGLFLTFPAGLWALAAVAAVVALYLFYRRYRPLPVTGLFLWGAPRRDGMGGRRVDRPVFGRSFWLDVLAAAMLALALAGPAWRTGTLRTVVVLDDSFSMRARDAHLAARGAAERLLADAAAAAAVVLAGPEPALLRGMAAIDRAEARAALAGYAPAAAGTNLQAAVALARELFGQGLEIHIFTNREAAAIVPGEGSRAVVHVLPGRGGNLAFGELWREAGERPGRERLILSAVNWNTEVVEATLSVRVDAVETARSLYEETLRLSPGERRQRVIALTAVGRETLTATLSASSGDVIAADSTAWLPPSPAGTVTYAVEGLGGDGARFFRLGLEAAGCVPAAPGTIPDLLVTANGERSGAACTLEITPPGEPGMVAPPYVLDYASPLCRDLDLSAVVWVAASPGTPGTVAESYISAGDLPLYWRSSAVRYHLNLVPEKSPLVYDPSWPALLANLAARTAERRPGLGQTLYRPGETLRHGHAPGSAPGGVSLEAGGAVAATSRGGRPLAMPRSPGLYAVLADGMSAGRVAVAPLYGDGSDATALAAAAETIRFGETDDEGDGVHDLRWAALVAGLLALLANWRKETACR